MTGQWPTTMLLQSGGCAAVIPLAGGPLSSSTPPNQTLAGTKYRYSVLKGKLESSHELMKLVQHVFGTEKPVSLVACGASIKMSYLNWCVVHGVARHSHIYLPSIPSASFPLISSWTWYSGGVT